MPRSAINSLPMKYRIYGPFDCALAFAGRVRVANRHPMMVLRNKLNTLLFKRIFTDSHEVMVRTASNFDIFVFLNDQGAASLLFERKYDQRQTLVLQKLLASKEAFIDIGANYGYFSLLASTSRNDLKAVVAIEPNPSLTSLIKRSACQNGLNAGHFYVLQQAISESQGSARLNWSPTLTSSGGLEVKPNFEHSVEVETETIDSVVQKLNLGEANLLVKIDVEGFELQVLSGAESVLNFGCVFIVEVAGSNAKEVAHLLSKYDYIALDFQGSRVTLADAPRTKADDYVLCRSDLEQSVADQIKPVS